MGRKNCIILLTIFVITGVTLLFSVLNACAETLAAQEKEASDYAESGSELIKLEDVLERNTSGYAGIDRGENITWSYNAVTKTLAFSGSGEIMSNEDAYNMVNGGVFSYDENILGTWYIWLNETEHLVIGEGITGIGHSDFMYFPYLADVSLPNSLRYIADTAFAFGGLKSVTIPKGVRDIGPYAFCETKLSKVTIKNGVKRILTAAFSDTQIEKIVFPKSVEYIDDEVLEGCEKLKKVTLSPNIREIPKRAFSDSGLRNITIKNGIKWVAGGAFSDTLFKEITLPKSVDTILGDDVFMGSNNLKTVKIKSKKLKIESKAFRNFPSKATIIVPKGKKKSYSKMFYKAGLSKKVKIKESKKWSKDRRGNHSL